MKTLGQLISELIDAKIDLAMEAALPGSDGVGAAQAGALVTAAEKALSEVLEGKK